MTTPNTQTVDQSLTLQCEVTTVRGITSRVNIVWSSNGTEIERMNNVLSTTMDNSLVYTDAYTISQLSTNDDGRVIQCEVVIQTTPSQSTTNTLTLDVTGQCILVCFSFVMHDCVLLLLVPQPSVSISQSVDSPNVGQNYILTCTVTVASGVSSSLVEVNWSGGASLLDSPRVTISDVTNNGLQYTTMITFSPLYSRDGGQYTCFVSVDGFDEADNLDSIIIVVVNGK